MKFNYLISLRTLPLKLRKNMTKKIFIFWGFIYLSGANAFGYQFQAKVEIVEKKLKDFQTVAKAQLPFPENGYIYVTDVNGLKVPSIAKRPTDGSERTSVYFKTNENNVYYVYYFSEERKQDTSIFEIPDGRVIIDDYINPSARTSGFWFWTSNPVLSGRFSHTGRSMQNINSHYTAIIPSLKTKSGDILFQYVFIDKTGDTNEIMLEIQSKKRKSYYFSWGSDIIKWKNINKIQMGNLPEKGKWACLVVPVDKMGKDVEITGVGFYHAGGRVWWDYTCVGNPALETKVLSWKKEGKNISAFFETEKFGPFEFSKNNFNLLFLNADASLNADSFEWVIGEKKYSGNPILEQFDEKTTSVPVKLICKNSKQKNSDTFSETIIFQKGKPEEVNLFLRILPHKNLINTGEQFYIPVRVGSLMSTPVPVEFSIDGRKEFLVVLPGKENSKIINLFFNPVKPEVHDISMKMADILIEQKKVVFLNVDEIGEKNLDGPYLKSEQGDRIVGIIPDYKLSNNVFTETEVRHFTVIGDVPDDFIDLLKSKLQKSVEWLKYPEKPAYHVLLNPLWLKETMKEKNLDTVIFFPSLKSLLRRTPVDEYVASLDASIWFLSKKTANIVCVTPFPSAPDLNIFKIYADATKQLCKKRNVPCLDLYDVFMVLPDWEKLFLYREGIYKNFPSQQGIQILIEAIEKVLSKNTKAM